MKKDYYLVPNHIFDHNLSFRAIGLYVLIAGYADEKGLVNCHIEDLCSRTGLSPMQTCRLLKELEKSRLISCNKPFITLPDLNGIE